MNTDPENRKHSVARRRHLNVLANAGEVVRGLRDRKPTQHNAEISARSTEQMSYFLSRISS